VFSTSVDCGVCVGILNELSRRLRCYAAKLISPKPGQVPYPGQKVKVEWKSVLPHIDLMGCEMELFLSLDGGRTFNMCITPILDPKAKYFYWTLPDLPSNAAVLDIRFGCDGW
jgi:hypothetical protein